MVGELAAHAKPGTVIAIHSTISPETAVELAERVHAAGPFTSSTRRLPAAAGRAKKGELAVMVGADREVYRARSSRLQAVGIYGHSRGRIPAPVRE